LNIINHYPKQTEVIFSPFLNFHSTLRWLNKIPMER